MLSGFNTYKASGDIEVTKNHLLFTFRNIPVKKRMNPTNNNTGGYAVSEIRTFLEGANGNGTGDYAGTTTVTTGAFLNALKAQIGDYILPVRRMLSVRPSSGKGWDMKTCSLFLPTEYEIYGINTLSDLVYDDGLKVQFPIYQKVTTYRCKKYNGILDGYWKCSPDFNVTTAFCLVTNMGSGGNGAASNVIGITPAFCVA
jgi:hypothetical protein